ncbi:hypothetical protein OB955_08120 [Halobacteria archaeon AArc-m2/3/4]|uniref:DUF7968 domain-containing protein n=1 Tax=Natronoglomus mannanivorans TaxID=2979990 RepID=A0AAP2YXJ9_9EURY|nr:hypothetical protein [Halobacteria archaeon AArc-xg1-1]MCU4972703.1 hypothetical protein [Halobacteria archaeon AArc-m2/3/4]
MAQKTDRGRADEREEGNETAQERADRIVVSYPEDLSDWGRFQVEKPSFVAFLLKTRDRASEGDVWEEFVDVGCCGSTLDVPLRVERIEGGSVIDEETDLTYEVREACGIEGSWQVQSEGGPKQA